jgi:hypothetical protein
MKDYLKIQPDTTNEKLVSVIDELPHWSAQFGFNILILLVCIFPTIIFSQSIDDEIDKCGYDSPLAKSYLEVLGEHWGYGYDDLLTDLANWSLNPYITIDSLGASVQNRAIWQLTITDTGSTLHDKETVFIHARTHPGEIQSWWVTEEIIYQLTSETQLAQVLRENCVFYIIPMYNPDGVELQLPRHNANGVDLESNWNSNPVQPEVAVLRSRFTDLMATNSPIRIAMNMHSAYGTHRFFVYHDSTGTSAAFTYLEKDYIEGVRYYYINGIEPWYYRITWTTGTPSYYPESWFWINFQEAVMALTYEDWNDPLAFNFDSTANAMLHGIADYLDIQSTFISGKSQQPTEFELYQNYPNPFNSSTIISFKMNKSENVQLSVLDITGRTVEILLNKSMSAGAHSVKFNTNDLASGVYLYHLKTGSNLYSKKMLLIK